jgi:DNA replication protein DnaC
LLQHPLFDQLHALRLRGMAAALEHQLTRPDAVDLSFEDRLALLLQHEVHDRKAQKLGQRLRWAKLAQSACLEDLDTKTPRGLQKIVLGQVTDLAWIRERLNVLLCGPTGVGKSWIACAIGHSVCRADHSVRFFRMPRLIDELARATAMSNRSGFFRQIAKVDLLILDDFGLAPLTEQTRRDLLEVLDDRYDKKSTLITSQLPVEQWHAYLGDPTLADAILDRLVHNSYRLNLTGESMRKRKTTKSATPN